MRTKTLLLTAALSAAGIATSMAQVYSVNAVGYVNTTLLPGFNLVSNPLNNTSGNTIANLFGTGIQGTIPDGTIVYYFNSTTDQFVSAVYDSIDAAFGPAANAATVIPAGEGAFVFVPGNANVTCTFVGEVPQGAASNQQLPQGFSIKGSTVPAAGPITGMNFPAAGGDIIYEWNPTTDQYVASVFDDIDNAWGPQVPNIDVGEAFFVFKGAAATWTRNFDVNAP
jgi:hypothetical protein